MIKSIRTYDELVAEKERLEKLLQAQKELIRCDFEEIKHDFKPAMKAVSFAGRLLTRDTSNPLLNLGVNSIIDLLFKKVILAKSGWISRFLIPFFLKNYSSHIVDDNVDEIKERIFSIFTGKNGKPEQPETAAR